MASQHQVRQYLAYWFQLGKQVVFKNGRETLLPRPVIAGDRYSPQFEAAWQHILANAAECHLEGTDQTIANLLSPAWEINPCARCDMPVPVASIGLPSFSCPCSDLSFWPDNESPRPRSPVSSQAQLVQIRDRLMRAGQKSSEESQAS